VTSTSQAPTTQMVPQITKAPTQTDGHWNKYIDDEI
jgi:hypothetical protein